MFVGLVVLRWLCVTISSNIILLAKADFQGLCLVHSYSLEADHSPICHHTKIRAM